jgi:AraC-like DNA-binding protein
MDSTLFQKECDLYENTDIGMYYCGKRINTPNHVYGPEIRNYYLFVLVNKGEATLFHKNGEIKFGAHDMLIMCPGEKIHYVAETPWSIQWVGLYGQTIEKYMKLLKISGDDPIVKIEKYYEMEEILEELYLIGNSRTEQLRCKQMELIYKFFSLLWKKEQKIEHYDIADSAKKIIDYNFYRDITIKKVAEALHLDSAYLTRKFVEKYAIAPKEYIIDKRIEMAKNLLINSDVTVTEIAISIGYDDPLYFSRIFKIKEGISPLTYRKQFK